jgi:hypothetical protein
MCWVEGYRGNAIEVEVTPPAPTTRIRGGTPDDTPIDLHNTARTFIAIAVLLSRREEQSVMKHVGICSSLPHSFEQLCGKLRSSYPIESNPSPSSGGNSRPLSDHGPGPTVARVQHLFMRTIWGPRLFYSRGIGPTGQVGSIITHRFACPFLRR